MKRISVSLSICLLVFTLVSSNSVYSQDNKEEEGFSEVLWELKAVRSTSDFIKVVAIDKSGRKYDIYSIQDSNQSSFLDVKAFVKGKRLSVKMLAGNEKYYSVKAIDDQGNILDIKAITENGMILPVKGVSKSGNIIHIRAIDNDEIFYNIVAMSPKGKVNDLKGIKITNKKVEAIVNGVKVFAHIKSMSQ